MGHYIMLGLLQGVQRTNEVSCTKFHRNMSQKKKIHRNRQTRAYVDGEDKKKYSFSMCWRIEYMDAAKNILLSHVWKRLKKPIYKNFKQTARGDEPAKEPSVTKSILAHHTKRSTDSPCFLLSIGYILSTSNKTPDSLPSTRLQLPSVPVLIIQLYM